MIISLVHTYFANHKAISVFSPQAFAGICCAKWHYSGLTDSHQRTHSGCCTPLLWRKNHWHYTTG